MATHLGLTVVPKGADTSFAGKTPAAAPTETYGPLAHGIGYLRIERFHLYRAIGSILIVVAYSWAAFWGTRS